MKKSARVISTILSIVVLLVIVVGGLWLWLSSRPFPKTSGRITVSGIDDDIEIYRDPQGIPHIYAGSTSDLYFAQGYVHAQDRYWQMEFWKRIGSGRLAELFGESVLPTDIYLRTMGFKRVVDREISRMDKESLRALEAYAAGVNAYILNRRPGKLALEFALLGIQGVDFEIEPWEPANTLTWLKLMSQDLGGNMTAELLHIDVIRAVGTGMAADFFAPFRSDTVPHIVLDEELVATLSPSPQAAAVDLEGLIDGLPTRLVGGFDSSTALTLGRGTGIGSNSWVVSGDLTTTGKPILANDPHLGIQMPSIWYEIGLHLNPEKGQQLNVRGFSFAGVPGIIIGHNDDIAWGVTNLGPDVQDLYIERINPEDPHQYEVNGQWVDMDVVYEEIQIHGRDDPYFLQVRNTRHGPIVTDHGAMLSYSGFGIAPVQMFPRNLELTALSLRWPALEDSRTFQSVLMLNRATNFREFREALRYWDIPSQNFVYADMDGNIGYQTPGLIPIRPVADGRLPVPGWTDEHEWTGYIPFEELPWVLNPAKGYIATANQPVVSDAYPYLIHTEASYGYRARRIVELIQQNAGSMDLQTIAAMQADTLNLSAMEILPYLRTLHVDDEKTEDVRRMLLDWDHHMDPDSAAAAVYGFFYVALANETYEDQFPAELWESGKAASRGDRVMNSLFHLLAEPQNPWWDDIRTPDEREDRDAILIRALEQARESITEELGKKQDKWRWGAVHRAVFRNMSLGTSGISIIESIFNRGPVEVGGGLQQVTCTDFKLDEPFEVYAVSSMRQIIDLSDLGASLMMHTTGQSGHPRHDHYDDFIEPWARVEFHPTRWSREVVEKQAKDRLVLRPGN